MPKRTDANQTEIVSAFRKMGCSVFITSAIGKGFPDIICGISGVNYLIEIKDGTKTSSKIKLTPLEHEFHLTWLGQVCIIKSVQDAINFVNVMRLKK